MNNKHARFLAEYLIDQNATRAAIAAGYSPKTARSQGSRLLTNADIQIALREQQEQLSTELKITAADKRRKLWAIAQFCSEVVEGVDGEFSMRNPRAATAAVAELNKMDGEYKQAGNELPQVTFIQQFGDSSGHLKDQQFVVTAHQEE
ncbi:terminase small subunit [Endozoicomonas sp. ALC020]|uniref:terminase small subunit n=1 Tax=unclassified Endozoicomonas TaxID=2644528 RepID=UPI003BB074F0